MSQAGDGPLLRRERLAVGLSYYEGAAVRNPWLRVRFSGRPEAASISQRP
jgi:hypothetical protein